MIGMIKRLIYVIFTIPAFFCLGIVTMISIPFEMMRTVFVGFRQPNESSYTGTWPGYIDDIVTKLKPEK